MLYSESLTKKVARFATQKDSPLSSTDRVGLVLDAPALAKAGMTKASDALSFIQHFRSDVDGVSCIGPFI